MEKINIERGSTGGDKRNGSAEIRIERGKGMR
jgi:hypothetical protein